MGSSFPVSYTHLDVYKRQVVTPTEAADISVIYALIVSIFCYRTFKFSDIPSALKEAARTCLLYTSVSIDLVVSYLEEVPKNCLLFCDKLFVKTQTM